MSSTECPSSLNFEPRPTPVQQNDTLLTQQTLAIHGYDECHRRVPFDAFWWSLPDRLHTVEMHIFCRKQLCFRPKTKKKRNQRNTFSPEIETDRKQSKSLFSAPETKTKFGQSLLPTLLKTTLTAWFWHIVLSSVAAGMFSTHAHCWRSRDRQYNARHILRFLQLCLNCLNMY